MRKYLFCLLIAFVMVNKASAADEAGWKIAKSSHFIVHYKSAPENFVSELISKAEGYYDKIADDLGFRRFNFWLWENRANVYVYDTVEDYQSATGEPAWSGGRASVKNKMIETFPYAQGFFETLLPHELGHIIFREFVNFDNPALPLWLDEGVASYQEKSRYAGVNAVLKSAKQAGDFMGLKELTDFDTRKAKDNNLVALFYAEAFSVADFLIKKFGSNDFMRFCQELRDKKDLEKAIVSAYRFNTLGELDEAWQKHILYPNK